MALQKNNRKGTAMIEVSLMLPLIAFLFMGAFDMGYYAFALISLQDATRVAALYTSTNSTTAADSAGACTYVVNELKSLPNIDNTVTTCSGTPLTVTVQSVSGPGSTTESVVSVTYQSSFLFPIPGVLADQFTWTRAVSMPLRG
jgi:Flp pilus assembly protein TadG